VGGDGCTLISAVVTPFPRPCPHTFLGCGYERALNGDDVVIKLLPVSTWMRNERLATSFSDESGAVAGAGAGAGQAGPSAAAEYLDGGVPSAMSPKYGAALVAVLRAVSDGLLQPRGEVVAISQRRHNMTAVGMLEPWKPVAPGSPLPHGQHFKLNPSDKRIPFIHVPREAVDAAWVTDPSLARGKVVVVEIVRWTEQGLFPQGTVVGPGGDSQPAAFALLVCAMFLLLLL
jgi:exoribonuclease R